MRQLVISHKVPTSRCMTWVVCSLPATRCRYTGKLPDASPEELLKMIRLADQYQVGQAVDLVCVIALRQSSCALRSVGGQAAGVVCVSRELLTLSSC
jgi:hypothetical protein